jgi:hypothetical protein
MFNSFDPFKVLFGPNIKCKSLSTNVQVACLYIYMYLHLSQPRLHLFEKKNKMVNDNTYYFRHSKIKSHIETLWKKQIRPCKMHIYPKSNQMADHIIAWYQAYQTYHRIVLFEWFALSFCWFWVSECCSMPNEHYCES